MNKTTKSGVIWITGLSGSGKTTFANALCKYLKQNHDNVVLLEGEKYREFFNDFGYKKEERLKSSYQFVNLIKFLEENDLIIIVATITAFKEIYDLNRNIFKNYFEIYIHCDFEELIRRDKKGLYSGALNGKIKNVVGVDIPYEEPRAHYILENTALDCFNEKRQKLCQAVNNFLNQTNN